MSYTLSSNLRTSNLICLKVGNKTFAVATECVYDLKGGLHLEGDGYILVCSIFLRVLNTHFLFCLGQVNRNIHGKDSANAGSIIPL